MFELPIVPAVDGTATLLAAVLQDTSGELEDWQMAGLVAAMCFPIGIVALKLGADRYRKSRIVQNTVTERVRSMAVGRTELKGVARPYRQTYQQPFTDGECVYGRWRVQEHVEVEPHDDDNEKKTWETVASGGIGDNVVLEDDTGAVTLERPSMDYSDTLHTRKKEGLLQRLLGSAPGEHVEGFLQSEGIALESDDRRRYDQWVLPEGTELYVLGQATRRDDRSDDEAAVVARLKETYDNFVDELVIERDEGSGEYMVTDRSEDEISRHHFLRTLMFLLAGIGMVALGAAFLGMSLQEYGLI